MVAFMHTGTRLTAGYRYTTLGDATNTHRSKGQVEVKQPSKSHDLYRFYQETDAFAYA